MHGRTSKSRWRGTQLETVRLEHQEFEQRYEVSSTDQIEARALLTPAFMERFVELATRSGIRGARSDRGRQDLDCRAAQADGSPAICSNRRLLEPAGGAVWSGLENDIRAVLKMADTVIKLDFWAAGRQRDAREQRSAEPTGPNTRLDDDL